jgi:hypothetical protein
VSQISILDARLAEIDRRLESIQTGLTPPEEPAPAPPPPPAPPTALPLRVVVPHHDAVQPAAAGPVDREMVISELRALAAAHERLLESVHGLLALLEPGAIVIEAANGNGARRPGPEFTVSAGPFITPDALRDFERSLARMPDVREVEVRAYEGGNRAIVDVQLFEPTS